MELDTRGQLSLTIKDKEITLRANFSALSAIEEIVGGDLIIFLSNIQKSNGVVSIPVGKLGRIFYELQKAGGGKMPLGECGDLVMAHGVLPSMKLVLEVLTAAIKAGSDEMKAKGGGDPS